MGKKDRGDETEEERAARKAAKKAAKAEAAGAESPKAEKKKKKDKDADDDKAAKKAAKKAKREAEEAAAADTPAPKKAKKSEDAPAKTEEPAAADENNRVFVGNLPFSMTDDWIKEIFQPHGTVSTVEWLSHADTGRFKGAGFLTMGSGAEASAACAALNGQDCEGRPMPRLRRRARRPRRVGSPARASRASRASRSSSATSRGRSTRTPLRRLRRVRPDLPHQVGREGRRVQGHLLVDFETVDAATKAVALAGTSVAAGRCASTSPRRLAAAATRVATTSGAPPRAARRAGARSGRMKPAGPKPDGCLELFCGNLSWSIDEEKVTAFFKGAGATVTGTRWLNDKETGEFKGIGFVAFADTADVDKAVTLGGEQLDGRPIRLDYAGQKPKKEGAWQGGW